MIDWNKPIETVDGREARFIGPEPLVSLPEARIVHVRERNLSPLSCGDVFLVNNEGYRCDDRAIYSKRQEPFIRNVWVKREGWVRVRREHGAPVIASDMVYSSRNAVEEDCELRGGVPAFVTWEE